MVFRHRTACNAEGCPTEEKQMREVYSCLWLLLEESPGKQTGRRNTNNLTVTLRWGDRVENSGSRQLRYAGHRIRGELSSSLQANDWSTHAGEENTWGQEKEKNRKSNSHSPRRARNSSRFAQRVWRTLWYVATTVITRRVEYWQCNQTGPKVKAVPALPN